MPIKPGDVIDIVAPASKCAKSELNAAIKILQSMGFKPRVPRNLFAPSVLFSNSDQVRLQHLQKALLAPDSKMIWCVRGGYGSLRLTSHLQRLRRPKTAKIFLGYSDITTLHTWLNQDWGWPTLHGPMLDRLGRGAMAKKEQALLFALLTGQHKEVLFNGLRPLNAAARVRKVIRGPVVGGNLAVLQSGMGTPNQLGASRSILFLEDIGERPHRMDRMLTQFAQAGVFKQAKAVVFGHFLLHDAKDRRQLWQDVIPRFSKEQRIPVLKGLPVGHSATVQMPMPLNTSAVLQLGTNASLRLDSGIGES
jgi:muramoyltetrapeptide carboxypeptidase